MSGKSPARVVPEVWPCCRHCIDGDGMLPCYNIHDEPCGDCAWTDTEIREWRKRLEASA